MIWKKLNNGVKTSLQLICHLANTTEIQTIQMNSPVVCFENKVFVVCPGGF